MAALNKRILCFVDECGTADDPVFALGCVMAWARECGRANKSLGDLLEPNANELHTADLTLTAQRCQSGHRIFDILLKRRIYHRFGTSQSSGVILICFFGCVRLTDASVASESLAGRKVATTFTPSRAPDTVRCQVKRR